MTMRLTLAQIRAFNPRAVETLRYQLRSGATRRDVLDAVLPGVAEELEAEDRVRAAPPRPTPPDPYEAALRDITPGRGAYAQVVAMGLDYDEFKRRSNAQEHAA